MKELLSSLRGAGHFGRTWCACWQHYIPMYKVTYVFVYTSCAI